MQKENLITFVHKQTGELNSQQQYITCIDAIVNKEDARYNNHDKINYCALWGFINKK